MTLRSFNVLWCLLVIRNSQAQCTLCVDPQDPANDNPSASVGGVECASIAEGIASLPSNSSLCLETQGSAYVNCNCRAFPEEYFCAMCADASLEIIFPRRTPPSALQADITCGDSLLVFEDNVAELYGSCESLQRDAFYCGCPGSSNPPTSSMTPSAEPSQTALPTPAPITPMPSSSPTQLQTVSPTSGSTSYSLTRTCWMIVLGLAAV